MNNHGVKIGVKRKHVEETPILSSSSEDYENGVIKILSNDALIRIFSYLNAREINLCSGVCKLWNRVSKNPQIWKSIYFHEIKLATISPGDLNDSEIGNCIQRLKDRIQKDENRLQTLLAEKYKRFINSPEYSLLSAKQKCCVWMNNGLKKNRYPFMVHFQPKGCEDIWERIGMEKQAMNQSLRRGAVYTNAHLAELITEGGFAKNEEEESAYLEEIMNKNFGSCYIDW